VVVVTAAAQNEPPTTHCRPPHVSAGKVRHLRVNIRATCFEGRNIAKRYVKRKTGHHVTLFTWHCKSRRVSSHVRRVRCSTIGAHGTGRLRFDWRH
jgi:hypothetical protein